jgi:hypothetical protein
MTTDDFDAFFRDAEPRLRRAFACRVAPHTVASLLGDGALNLDERFDLQELAPATFERDDVARALAAWCAAGCDTTRPTAADLRFDRSYSLERNGRTISAVWFEGTYSISGLPFPTVP